MATPRQLAKLTALEPLMGPIAIVNVALLLCGARKAYIFDHSPFMERESATIEQMREHVSHVIKAVTSSFKNVKALCDSLEPMFYRADLADPKDVKIAGDFSKKGPAWVKARGRLLGYAGTACPCSKYPDAVTVYVACDDARGKTRVLTQFCAHPAEVYPSIQAFQALCDKAKKVVGVPLTPSLTLKGFHLRIGPEWKVAVRIDDSPPISFRRSK